MKERILYPVLTAVTFCVLLATALFLYRLTRVHLESRRGDVRTMKAYKEAVERDERRGWMQADASLKEAEALLRELKTDEALEALDSNSEEYLNGLSPNWRLRILRMRAQVLSAQGKESEAWDAYRKAHAIEGSE